MSAIKRFSLDSRELGDYDPKWDMHVGKIQEALADESWAMGFLQEMVHHLFGGRFTVQCIEALNVTREVIRGHVFEGLVRLKVSIPMFGKQPSTTLLTLTATRGPVSPIDVRMYQSRLDARYQESVDTQAEESGFRDYLILFEGGKFDDDADPVSTYVTARYDMAGGYISRDKYQDGRALQIIRYGSEDLCGYVAASDAGISQQLATIAYVLDGRTKEEFAKDLYLPTGTQFIYDELTVGEED